MKLLLDECVPEELTLEFTIHSVRTVRDMGWLGMKNGELLKNAAEQFDILVTLDQRIPTSRTYLNTHWV